MNSLKTIIDEAVSRYPLTSMPEWAKLHTVDGVAVERIETDGRSIQTVDYLFDGEAKVFLSDSRTLNACVFGRCDGRRASIDRLLFVN